jgi:4-amino-4-deoxy-L-arabinose transferase-like glycosyltransferase
MQVLGADAAGQRGTGAAPRVPLWASPAAVALIVLALTVPRIVFAARYGLIGDETYYALWSLYPGFGYYDHSPGVAWVIWLGRALFGEGPWAVRSLFILSSFVICAALYRTALLLFEDARIGAVAAIAFAVTPAVMITTTVATPDGPSTMFWALAVWAIAEFTRSRNANWWLAAGVFAGLGLLSKYTVVFLGAGILLYLVTSRERLGWLRLWQVWAGGAIAIFMFAPVVWIDWTRNWASFRFQLGRSTLADGTFRPDEFARFLIETGIQLLPTLFVFALIGIVVFFARRASGLALPLLTSAPMLAYFLVHGLFGRVNPNWVAPAYPMLALIGAWAVISIRPSAAWLRWPLDTLKVLHVPIGLGIMLTGLAAVEFRALPVVGPLPLLGYFYGWDNFQAKISDLAEANGAQWVETPDYSLTGMLAYYGKMADDPLPVYETGSKVRYRFRPPLSDEMKAVPHLIVRVTRGKRLPELPGARPLAVVTRDDSAGTPLQSFAVYLANG